MLANSLRLLTVTDNCMLQFASPINWNDGASRADFGYVRNCDLATKTLSIAHYRSQYKDHKIQGLPSSYQ